MTRLPHILLSIASIGFASVAADNCKTINNLPYCNEVSAITYKNVGASGTYQDVTGYDPDACTCSYTPKSFGGTLAPLDEQLSIHCRGPLSLKQVAVYTPGTSTPKKLKRHAHHAHHKRHKVYHTSKITQMVTVVYGDEPKQTLAPGNYGHDKAKSYDTGSNTSGSWVRESYYDAESQILENLTFMNHKGGDKSGVFDYCIGNSLSFADEDGTAGSANPVTLKDTTLPSDQELVLFTGEKCDESCGYVRPGVPAYKGFDGSKKIFLFEFGMPHDTANSGFNYDLPAIWLLNAKIPRAAQYGKKAGGDGKLTCSCWDSGCGELDVFEVIDGAPDYVKTHYHSKQGASGDGYGGGGCPDYFPRPAEGTVKAAVVFDGTNDVTITFLPDDTEFPSSFNDDFAGKCKVKGGKALAPNVSPNVGVFTVPS